MLMNKESLTLYRTHDIEPFNLEDWDYDEDSVHPNFYKFKKERATWTTIESTNRGIDNCVGYFYWSPREKCICCENGFDERMYAWNVAHDIDHLINLWHKYTKADFEGGFVDWLMERPKITPICYNDICCNGQDPYNGLFNLFRK